MKKTIRCLLLGVFSLFFQFHISAQEICDNAVDDDGDGLVDLNDDDCDCPMAEPLSLIPNPSFEEMDCCPVNRSQLVCATDWIQASEPTTDYLHTCGWMGWDDLPPPLPFPDGEGCIGFRDGRPPDGPNGPGSGGGPARPNWKEYAGACLTSPLEAGVEYRFEFYIGFTTAPNSPPLKLTLFGSPDCDNLPFGNGDSAFGCPTNGPGWKKLEEIDVSGTFEWKPVVLTVTPEEDIHTIVIGPGCFEGLADISHYYFLDKLTLAAQTEFDFTIKPKGNPCVGDIILQAPEADTLNYQWYFNGVALIGETEAELQNVGEVGEYQVRIIGPNSCGVLPTYSFQIPEYTSIVNQTICADEIFQFGGQALGESGKYVELFESTNGCDSTATLNLEVLGDLSDTVDFSLLKSENLIIGPYNISEAGEHVLTFESSLGCDSVVLLQLDYLDVYIPNIFSPNGDGINDYFNVFVESLDVEITEFHVFDRWGSLVYFSEKYNPEAINTGWDGSINGELGSEGVYAYFFKAKATDGEPKIISGSVTLIR